MKSSQMQFEGILLTGSPDDSFAEFYRSHVRLVPGERLPFKQLTAAYVAWADEYGLLTSSAQAVRSFMEANGHTHRKSNVIYYADAVLGEFKGDPLPKRNMTITDARPIRDAVSVMAGELDDIIAELVGMRRRLGRLVPSAGSGKRA